MSVGALHEEHRSPLSQSDDLGATLRSQLFRERFLENFGAFKRAVELGETNAGSLPCLVLDVNKPGVPAKREFALHKQSHTSSGAPGVLGPSECRPELPGDGAEDVSGHLQFKADSLTYVTRSVLLLRHAASERDRNSNNAVICDARSRVAA